jgi:hypothetical protein
MTAYTKARLIAVLILGSILCAWLISDESGKFLMGKAAYLAREADRWDHNIAHPPGLAIHLIIGLALVGVVAAFYEVISQVTEHILSRFFAADRREEKC